MGFEAYSQSHVALIEEYIQKNLEDFAQKVSQRFSPLINAMQYSLESGGKRLRPLLVLASAESLGIEPKDVLPAAASIEYIHTYSLIHDDLPALDDDDMRRGKPSSHKKFGEAVAILAGDALLTEAFGVISGLSQKFKAEQVIKSIQLLVQHAGIGGMVGGQYLDVTHENSDPSVPEVEFIHIHKTGGLILASVLLPTPLVSLNEETAHSFRVYGEALGLAFQISDDLLDSEATFRYSRGPRKKPKPSYTQVTGPSESRERLNRLIDRAIQSIEPIGDKVKPLIDIAEFIRTRKI